MPKKISITADHVTYEVDSLPAEYTHARLWAIQKQYPTNEAEFHMATNFAKLWYYSKTLGCEYNAAIQRKISQIGL